MTCSLSRWLASLLAASGLAFSIIAHAAADSPQANAVVRMTDTAFYPAAVTIVAGGNVTWVNDGARVHTATSIGGAPLPFDTGGLGTGQQVSFGFTLPGDYYYTSVVDCPASGPGSTTFPCSISYLVQVIPPAGVAAPASPAAVPTPATIALPVGPARSATIIISDRGMEPASVVIPLMGTVTWVNMGAEVHSATSISSDLPPFNSGGLGSGEVSSINFVQPGNYLYTSSPDCLSPSNGPGFECGPYVLAVTNSPAQEQIVPAPATAPATTPAYAWLSKGINDPPVNCGSVQKLLGWLPPHRTPCIDAAANAGAQYVQGHVMDRGGTGIGGIIVRASISGNNYDATSDQDGTFSIILSTDCPVEPRVYSIYIIDGQGRQSSDARSVSYANCNVAGEFHFDFVRQ